ncbi:MAG: M20 family metallopeptidase [Anaerolineaceae bacterium]|nr:M20 family metallopeptidase [Anaerolineaceae bacterium]
MTDLLEYFQSQKSTMLALMDQLVKFETFTSEKENVDRMAAHLARQLAELGAEVQTHDHELVGNHVLARWNPGAEGKPLLFLTHSDTVWPSGTLEERPPRIESGKYYGPGAVDMKGGITVALSAMQGLQALGRLPKRPIYFLLTSDEEIGSPHSEELILDVASQCGLVLVMEPALPDESFKTARKGVGTYTIRVKGLPAHAGNAPEQGINAVVELARQILVIDSFNDLRRGTSVSVDLCEGGIAVNVIAPHASAQVDVRTVTNAAWEETRRKMMSLQPQMPGAEVQVLNPSARGPLERSEQVVSQVRQIAQNHGLTFREGSSGGGSDGNLTAAAGIPTLDGCGPQGDGLHALHEYVVIDSLPRRAAFMAAILCDWDCEQ